MQHRLDFSNGQSLCLDEGRNLSEVLNVLNSPVLFGCRTGICATCLVKVHEGMENLPPLTEDEQEVLEIYTDQEQCRLACQLHLKGNVKLEYIGH
ncbi:MAG: 2Fe-2S iron-sulfur cluster-binding protein [Candidatus Sericytochromatia bacterium]